ncbi:SGNH/GDSL hydrolase family protein [Desulfosporosinus fructosivorans]|uniref:SGNH/GDSL hydrolase family protein n=1 Tax=Desulfosporosinus fructosivorans TaxID=2018669 RepID=A0A4Z0R663_9FIRM|nr:SGNH/GDSL hydrolase family protein [Desulfosporosinus fructosivorans]TGE38328.1 SGNH/GDSL hydrolase family protein [Desulfosporosinus fructosivorans]
MKKIIIYLLTVILVLGIAIAIVTNDHVLTGISKLKSGTVNAVILGDSIAVSQGASNPLTTGWNSDLETSLFNKYSNKIVWDNKASAGTTIDSCLKRATEIVSTTDAVFICAGRIDRIIDTPDQFSKKYIQLINDIKSKAPNADIFCIVEPPMVSLDESLFLGIRTAIINASVKTGSNLLDVWSAFPQDEVTLGAFLMDGLHPNDAGYYLMSDFMYKRLVTVINAVERK